MNGIEGKLVGQSLKIFEVMQAWTREVPELVEGRDEFQRRGKGAGQNQHGLEISCMLDGDKETVRTPCVAQ